MERSIVQNLVRNTIKINEGDERMWGQTNHSLSGFYEWVVQKKEIQIQKYHAGSPLAFLHMFDSVIHTYLALGVMGAVLIGAVLLERYLVQNDYVSALNYYLMVFIMG